MSLRIKSQKYINLSRRSGRQETASLVGVVGDKIKAEIEFEYLSNFTGGANGTEIIFTPDPAEIDYPSGTNTEGYVYSPDQIFGSFRVGDKIAVFRQGVIDPVEYFDIIDIPSSELLIFDLGGSTSFTTRVVWGGNDYIGCAPVADSLQFNYSLDYVFNSFDVEQIGNGRWVAYEDGSGKIYTDLTQGVNKQPFNVFTIDNLLRTGDNTLFTFKIEHEFILYPFSLPEETAPQTPLRFQGANRLNYYFSINLSDSNSGNNREIVFTDDNGNTGGINQTVKTGVQRMSISDLVIVNSASEAVTTQLTPDTYTATFTLNYGGLVSNADDNAKAWGFIEQNEIDNNKTLRQFWYFDSATRNTGNFLTAAATLNDFSDVILIEYFKAEVISSNVVCTLNFTVTANTPTGNCVVMLNAEPNAQNNTRKNIFLFSLPIAPTPPDLGIRFEDKTAIQLHNTLGINQFDNREISPNQELLCVNRFWVTIPNSYQITNIRTRFVAQTNSGLLINTLEQTNIDLSERQKDDGVYYTLATTLQKAYPRAENDPFRALIIRRNEGLDTPTEQGYEVLTPYIFRYEFWARLAALNGETLNPAAFDPLQPFNGFNQQWQRYSLGFDNIIDLTVIAEGQQFTISSPLTSDPITFEDYTSGTITVENEVLDGAVIRGENTVKAQKTSADFTNYSATDFVGIMWANIREQGGITSNARLSSILSPDTQRVWTPNNVTISKPNATTVRLQGVLNGNLLGQGEEATIWGDIRINESNTFVFEVKTDNTSSGSTANDTFALPLVSVGTYEFTVDWGDGNTDRITAWDDTEKTHQYAAVGTYTVKCTGTLRGFRFNGGGDRLKFIKVFRWGALRFTDQTGQFKDCTNLTLLEVEDVLNFQGCTTTSFMFDGCTGLTIVNRMNEWVLGGITNFYVMLRGCTNFNTYINNWDVTGAVGNADPSIGSGLHGLFAECTTFNQRLDKWNVGNCIDFNTMFRNAVGFQQDISMWDMKNAGDLQDFMTGKTTANYPTVLMDKLYNGWAAQTPLQPTVLAQFGTIQYTSAGAVGRAILAGSPNNWNITSGTEI
jgi:hypothetical protein